jgi:phenol 2-monooxygenase (NADPH)
MPPTGRYYILVFTSNDLLDKFGTSQSALQSSVDTLQKFPKGTVNLIVMHPLTSRFEWSDLPAGVKTFAEMRTYGVSKKEDVYEVLGVSKDDGVVAVVRPDGYVGMMAVLSQMNNVEDYLGGCLVSI